MWRGSRNIYLLMGLLFFFAVVLGSKLLSLWIKDFSAPDPKVSALAMVEVRMFLAGKNTFPALGLGEATQILDRAQTQRVLLRLEVGGDSISIFNYHGRLTSGEEKTVDNTKASIRPDHEETGIADASGETTAETPRRIGVKMDMVTTVASKPKYGGIPPIDVAYRLEYTTPWQERETGKPLFLEHVLANSLTLLNGDTEVSVMPFLPDEAKDVFDNAGDMAEKWLVLLITPAPATPGN